MSNLTLWLAAVPFWLSALLVVALPVAISMALSAWVRTVVTLDKLSENNEVAGFKFAVLGVIYAVLIAFVVIVVWEKFRDADLVVAHEAGNAAAIYQLSYALSPEDGATIRARLTDYLHEEIDHDWPAMSKGHRNIPGRKSLGDLYAAIIAHRPTDAQGAATYLDLLRQVDSLVEGRRTRFVLAQGAVPGVIWCALLVGAAATIGFTFFFGTRNRGAQILMTGLLTAVVFMGLLVILSINHPFTGGVSVGPEPLEYVLQEFATGQ